MMTAAALLRLADTCTVSTTESMMQLSREQIVRLHSRTFWQGGAPLVRSPRIHLVTSTSLRFAARYAARGHAVYLYRQALVICAVSIDG